MKDCWLWLYRGAWHEWPTHEIEMAVPLSPQELYKKRKAIFMHQSQKDHPPSPEETSVNFGRELKNVTEKQHRSTETSALPNTKPSKLLPDGNLLS
jgi:glucosamine-6-phosphate deaminase